MDKYNPKTIEPKWQKYWVEKKLFKADDKDNKRPKFYCLDMFPYPSGDGLHVGHVESYTATDIYSKFMRMNGFNVFHPQGWDAFGLPAENYAIKTKVHPAKTTEKAINNFRRQIKSMGFSYDWDREINTSNPDYYKWTQWLFIELYKKGLAYQKMAPVNWCESCQTVLAREQVVDGKCERCKNIVVQKELKQWFFKITDYAEKLLTDLNDLDWPDKIKKMQENWIGRSEGALIKFEIRSTKFETNSKQLIEVFTTRPDTIFGATYLVIAPEHEIISKLKTQFLNFKEVEKYITNTNKKTELERTSLEKIKTGVEIHGIKAINPANKKEIPIFIADYVLTTYGTGAIMAVPAHDERDFEFARKYKQKIIEVISSNEEQSNLNSAYVGNGKFINSAFFNGKENLKEFDNIVKFVGGKKSIQYRLKDWLISRQRYWGAPIPIIYCDKCSVVTVPEKDLPVELPKDIDFRPTGESPLERSKKFHDVKCPICHSPARRESDTMDTFVCSSWYYLAYVMQGNTNFQFPISKYKEKFKKWLPVDLYVGGAEHAVMHLLYARFITKALQDMKYLNFNEPFLELKNQGLILASDGRKMSKSLGNVINPDEAVSMHGADTLRLFEMFLGPLEDEKPWDIKGIVGIKRFLEKVWKYCFMDDYEKVGNHDLHSTIKKVTGDIKDLNFNTAISAMMIFINSSINKKTMVNKHCKEQFLKILSPFAPHICEELWKELGNNTSIFKSDWPKYAKEIEKEIILPIQINGKVRARINIDPKAKKEQAVNIALDETNIKKWIQNNNIKKIIYIPGKILSIVI